MTETMIKAIIVEDDPMHAVSLIELIKEMNCNIEVLSVCINITDAFEQIMDKKPALVFLDIDLDRGENGFDLLRKFETPCFSVIFTTQYSNKNNLLAAIRACAFDFLSKPIFREELAAALERFSLKDCVEQISTLNANIEGRPNSPVEFFISNTDGKTKIRTDNVLYAESDNVYTKFYLLKPVNGRLHYISSIGIKVWENFFSNCCIVRIHNEFLVNISACVKFSNKLSGGATILLPNGIVIPVSKSRKKITLEKFKMTLKSRGARIKLN